MLNSFKKLIKEINPELSGKFLLLSILIFGMIISNLLFCTIINIPSDYATIQEGINSSVDEDTVLVQPGTYYENINFNGHNITVGSLFIINEDTSYISQTIIDNHGSVVTFENSETSTAFLVGFTIQNGMSMRGGGIMCDNNSSPTLTFLQIKNNAVIAFDSFGNGIGYGAGICCQNASCPIIKNVTLSDNWCLNYAPFGCCAYGGGICLIDSSNAIIENVTIKNNESVYGGGLAVINSDITIKDIEIYQNEAYAGGGGIYSINSEIDLINTNVVDNIVYSSFPNGAGGIYIVEDSEIYIINSIFWNNTTNQIYSSFENEPNNLLIAYSDIQDGESGIISTEFDSINWNVSNIDLDPLFTDPENIDYSLLADSPCIDSGTDIFIINGDTLLYYFDENYSGAAPDMGAIEFEVFEMPGDVNCDGIVDILDIISIVDHLITGSFPECIFNADLNSDGNTDILDILIIINQIMD